MGHQSVSSTNRYTRSDYRKQVATGNTVTKLFENEENKKTKVKKFVVKKRTFILVIWMFKKLQQMLYKNCRFC